MNGFNHAAKIAGLFFCANLLMGCLDKDDYQPNPVSTSDFALNKVTLKCGTETDCDGSVGILVHWEDNGYGQSVFRCTGFLVAPDIVATNNHCLPGTAKLLNTSSTTYDNFYFKTAKSKNGATQTARVLEVIRTDPRSGYYPEAFDLPDYAYLKLDRKLKLPIKKLNASGVKQGQKLHASVVNHYLRNRSGGDTSFNYVVDRVDRCQQLSGHHYDPKFYRVNSETQVVRNCQVFHGNSGGPMMSSDGKVVAILHAGVMADKIQESARLLEDRGYVGSDIEKDMVKTVIVTNVRCTEGVLGLKRDPTCDTYGSVSEDEKDWALETRLVRADIAPLVQQLNSPMGAWQNESFYFRLHEEKDGSSASVTANSTFSPGGTKEIFVPVPLCYTEALRARLSASDGQVSDTTEIKPLVMQPYLSQGLYLRAKKASSSIRLEMRTAVWQERGNTIQFQGRYKDRFTFETIVKGIPLCTPELIASFETLPIMYANESTKQLMREMVY